MTLLTRPFLDFSVRGSGYKTMYVHVPKLPKNQVAGYSSVLTVIHISVLPVYEKQVSQTYTLQCKCHCLTTWIGHM